jgi:hypothetical protein
MELKFNCVARGTECRSQCTQFDDAQDLPLNKLEMNLSILDIWLQLIFSPV